MDTKEEFKYETKSMDNAAVALALGAEIVKVDRITDERFFTFHFKGAFDMEKTSLELASKTLTINAYELCEAIRRMKSIIHAR